MPTIGFTEIVIMLLLLAVLAAVLYALVLLIKGLRKASRRLDRLETPRQDQDPVRQ